MTYRWRCFAFFCFSENFGFGRPTKDLYMALGVLVLKEMLDLTDYEDIDQLAFNTIFNDTMPDPLGLRKLLVNRIDVCMGIEFIVDLILQNKEYNSLSFRKAGVMAEYELYSFFTELYFKTIVFARESFCGLTKMIKEISNSPVNPLESTAP